MEAKTSMMCSQQFNSCQFLLVPLFDESIDFLRLFLTVEGHSIYIRNLPLYVTVAQLETEFAKFGPIKQNGVQVRSKEVSHNAGFTALFFS